MSFLDTVRRAKAYLEEQGRVSLSALRLEFDLDDARLASLVEELVDVQQVAAREGRILAWIDSTAGEPEPATATTTQAVADREPAAEAERRQLTVLFCDLVDSTELASQLDAEDLREIVRRYQEQAVGAIEGFEGHVAQYLGDGLLVYFGWPQAHEDDAERAVRSGLEVLRVLGERNRDLAESRGVELEVRIGIHTGSVVVGEMGSGERRETLALGDTANIAARVQARAAPGTVVISAETLRLVRGIFVTEELGPQRLKGVRERIPLYRVVQATGVQSRLVLPHWRLTRFVGREQELGILVDRWEQAVEGAGQTLFLSGEAGLGKSRMALVLRERLDDQPHTWLECRSSPYTKATAFQPVIELVKQGLAFGPADGAETKLHKIREGIGEAGLEAGRAVPLVADLLGVPLDGPPSLRISPELQRERTFETLVAWLLALGELQPVLVVAEDLHWCDPSSLELFGRLMEQIPTSPVLMVLTARPEFEVPWQHLKSWTPISLGRLRQRQARELVRSLSRERSLPDPAIAEILKRADGVPLYLEELTRTAVEAEEAGAPLTIPATLQDSLMARLDRLSSAKEVAQIAAVLGREFSYLVLEAVAELPEATLRGDLKRLEQADLLYQRGTPPEATYTFKHALIQERARESLLRVRRREIHARVARILEQRFPERAEAEPEVVARHYEAAGLLPQAIAGYQRAGERAMQQLANPEGIAHVSRALDLLSGLAETPARERQELQLKLLIGAPLTAVTGWGSEEVGETFSRARELAVELGDDSGLRDALLGLAAHEEVRGDLPKSLDLHARVLDLSKRSGDSFSVLCGHAGLGQPLYFLGRFSEAVLHFERAVALYSRAEHGDRGHVTGNDEGVVATSFSSWCLWMLGYPERSLQRGSQAVALAREVEHPFALAHALSFMARTHVMRREWQPAREYAEEGIALSTELGFPLYLGISEALRARVSASLEPDAKAVEQLQAALGQLAASGTGVGGPYLLTLLAEAQRAAGQREDALGALAVGLAMGKQESQPFADAELLELRGEILAEQANGEAEAERSFYEALEVSRRQQAKSLELRVTTSLARLWRDQGKRTEARDLLQPVYDWFTEGFDTQDLKDAKALLEELG